MSHEKRLVLFFLLIFLWMVGSSYLSRMLGWAPPPKNPPAVARAEKDKDPKPDLPDQEPGRARKAEAGPGTEKGRNEPQAKTVAKEGEPAGPPARPDVELVDFRELVLGSVVDKSKGGYRIEVQLEQKGAGVESVRSSRYDGEFKFGEKRKRPLEFIQRDPTSPPSLALTLSPGDATAPAAPGDAQAEVDPDKAALARAAAEAEDMLDSVVWEVERDPSGKARRPVTRTDPATKAEISGQAVVFRTKAKSGVVVTKTYTLFPNTDGFEVELEFASPGREQSIVYNLLGPHGIPIEGLWYTSTFRDLFFGQLNPRGATEIVTHSAHTVASAKDTPIDNTERPLRFAGVENQYFADLIEPYPPPASPEKRWDAKATALVLHKDDKALQEADVGVRISSRPITVSPDQSVVHTYRVFTGPKTPEALARFSAEALANYRKPQWIPLAPDIARVVITPTLGFTYQVTERVARFFGGSKGNYGIAIILLTIMVRALMFPLGRKQALSAQKMQGLQPHLKELQEKYKDDKERLTKETFALYKKHGVNPVSGCLPALIQLPIFVGLWQALNTSFPLRHASFLWIRDLAAPDMLFHLPFELYIPIIGLNLGSWFNALPFVVVGLMLFQTKLFAPPATTPDAEMQQKMMKFMMIFMGVMFYKVPSGLGIYFITSSLWAIGERLLLPKVTHAHATGVAAGAIDGERSSGKGALATAGRSASNGDGPGPRGGGAGDASGNGEKTKEPGWFAQFWERVLDEARKDPTYRKVTDDRDEKGRDKDRPRPKPRRR